MSYAQVAVLAHVGRAGGLFTYRVPDSLSPLAAPGILVQVPLASRTLQGVIYSLETETTLPRLRDIQDVLDPIPVVTRHGLLLARWISDYYAAPIADVIGAMIPPGLARKTVSLLEPGDEPNGHRLTALQGHILSAVREAGRLPLTDLLRTIPGEETEKAVTSLVRRRLLVRCSELAPPRRTRRNVRFASITLAGREALASGNVHGGRQRAVLERLANDAAPVRSLAEVMPGATGVVSALQRKGFVDVADVEDRVRSHDGKTPSQAPTLSPAQRAALRPILRSVVERRPDVYLLHGVTGSGKTEVYLHAIAETIRHDRQAILMVPEISLTPQMVERVAGRFPGQVAVLHSKLSDSERVEEWQRIRHGEAAVVVGPRSALFAPVPHPGLLILDEEHDASYKQDSSPRYNARDAAVALGRVTGAAVVLGSATPDTSTFYAAERGRIRLLSMPDRPVWSEAGAARPMPSVQVVDMRSELKSGNRGMFSRVLHEALEQSLQRQEQALLFLNRRGSATVVMCRDCGYVVRCPDCDIPFTFHAAGLRLICHRCNRRAHSPRTCAACGSQRIRYLGAGTQRVEEEVQRLFPTARVLRWDRDVTGKKDAHEQILQRFARHDADVLVGTQMIAKGLDFPLVTLVGVVSADTGLHMPDFRAPERTFQLLTQVAGRAGRAHLLSSVVVQSYTPEHYAIVCASGHDYDSFYRQELSFRESARYPPFARLARFVYSAPSETTCRQSAENLRAILEHARDSEALTGVEIIGPAPCFVARAAGKYYWQLIVRAPSPREIHALLDYVPPGWSIDVDPVDLL